LGCALTPQERADFERHAVNEIAASDWFNHRAVAYIQTHRALTLRNAPRKIAAGFSWVLNPNREPLAQAAYFSFYFPVSILGVTGMFLARRRWRECTLIYLLFVAFIGVTAVFWAHTSHRSYLDVYALTRSPSCGSALERSGCRDDSPLTVDPVQPVERSSSG